jgi:hypothetical protein
MTVERAHPRGSERARLRMVRADDHADVRAGIRLLLDGVSEWEVVGECVDAETAGEIVEGLYLSVRTRRDASQPDREQVRSRDRAQLGTYSSASVIGKEACTRARSSGGSAARVFGDFGQHCRPLGIVRNRRAPDPASKGSHA